MDRMRILKLMIWEPEMLDNQALDAVALSVRCISADAIEAAQSGHPGLPLGCAELIALLYGEILIHDPTKPDWINRDRFILSAGHGSILLYAILHLSGYGISLDEIRKFRQLGERTQGHPEYGSIPGIETTTGMLGQGFANAVGIALAERMLAARFNTQKDEVFDHYTYVLAGEGDLMEGVSYEAASLAGHLGLGKLIVFYDENRITIDGETDLALSENISERFNAAGWQVLEGDMYDYEAIFSLVSQAKTEHRKPSLIRLASIIGRGSPTKAGTSSIHGAVLGAEELRNMKIKLGVNPDISFYVDPKAREYFENKRSSWINMRAAWEQGTFSSFISSPSGSGLWKTFFGKKEDGKSESIQWPEYSTGDFIATRTASGKVLEVIARRRPEIIGGTADLTGPCFQALGDWASVTRNDMSGKLIRFGVREHAMGAVANGLALHTYGALRPFCATFLVFSDYMRPAVRMAALMKLPVIFVFSHDSIKIGEDGATHQPIEQLSALRLIPNLLVLRPADAEETVEVWKMAVAYNDGPVAIVTARQETEIFAKRDENWREDIRKGAYIVKKSHSNPDVVICATGSEVQDALKAAEQIPGNIQVVSIVSRELFLSQSKEFRKKMIPDSSKTVVLEAGCTDLWYVLFAEKSRIIGINRFGESGKGPEVARHLGISPDSIVSLLEKERT